MKSAGKIAVLALSLALAGALSACGGSGSASSASAAGSAAASAASATASAASSETAASDSASAAASEAASAASEAASEAASAASEAASAAASEAASAEAAQEYSNEYFGIAFEAPEGWVFADEESLAAANEETGAFDANATVDMIAVSPDNASKVMVAIEEANEYSAGQDAEEHLADAIEGTLENLENADNISYKLEDATIDFTDGSNLPAKSFEITVDGATIYVIQACAVRDDVFFSVLAQSNDQDVLFDVFSNFKLMA